MDLAVTRAFEFFKDHLVHATTGIYQGRGDDGERATFFNFASCTKETLGAL